jgi:hypothetical protein
VESNAQNSRDIVDTTDSLEAVGACRSMKNFLFIVILICLILTQLIFWLDRLGLIEQKACKSCSSEKQMQPTPATPDEIQAPPSAGPLPLAATVNVAEEVEKVTDQTRESKRPDETATDNEIILENQPDKNPAEAPAEKAPTESQAESEPDIEAFFRISCNVAQGLVAICNFLILAAAVLYSLTLLMCLKISLTGRLGGINHIARAFFISLFLLVFLIPWQRLLPGVLVGTVWLPGELLCGGWSKAHDSAFWKILFYLRFCGLWVVALWFLFWAQSRSSRWARATLRRLGVVR